MPSTTTTAAASSLTTLNLTGSSAASAKDAEDLDMYDEIEIEDMTYDPTLQIYHYPCPCGDRFEISLGSLREGEDVAVCPSCSLMVRVIFDLEDLVDDEEEGSDEEEEGDGKGKGKEEEEEEKEKEEK
ncbi:diphthamide biosynthesis protein [Fonsecaea pedrosoi]|nr:diphthamide biosynthesis protein [Fonsecaea pedrosoi]